MEQIDDQEKEALLRALALKFDISNDVLSLLVPQSDDVLPFFKHVDVYIRDKETQEDRLRQELGSVRRLRLNAEHQLSLLEKQLISCNSKLEKGNTNLEDVKSKLEITEKDLNEKKTALETVSKENEQILSDLEKLKLSKKKVDDEKNDLLEMVEKKNAEIDRLNDEWKTISEKAAAANAARLQLQEKLDEIQSQDITLEFKTKRLQQEKQLLQQQLDRLSDEMKSKTEDVITFKKDKNAELINLKSKLDEKEEEVTQLQSSAETAKKACAEQAKRIESLMERLKNSRENAAETESHFQQELAGKSRLVTLYKDSAEDGKKKISEMTTALEEIQKLCRETTEAKIALEAKAAADKEEFEKVKKENGEKISALENELRNANDLLVATKKRGKIVSESEISELSPSAVATSALLKKGMTLTQIYSEFVKISDALEDEKDENARLKQYMEQILQEIEEKSPLLKQQKEDYEHALVTIDRLTRNLDLSMKELHDLRGRCAEERKKSEFLKRENSRTSALNHDLSRQVRYLLKECEEARGGVVSTEQESLVELSSGDVSSSSQIISEHLVTFGTIEELQSQNEKLLAVVRELADENEKEENKKTREKLAELQDKFDTAMEELEEIKDERKRQEELVQTLARQRDMYKVLYSTGPKEQAEFTEIAEKTVKPLRRASLSYEAELSKSRAANDSLNEQFDDFRKEAAKKEETLQEDCDKLRAEISNLKIELQKMKSALEFSDERHKLLQTTIDGYARESAALQEKCKSITVAMGKAQSEAELCKQELEVCREKMIAAEVSARTLEAEKKMIKDAEKRLLDENKSLLDQQRSQNSVLTNLQTIQNSLERQEFETRSKLGSQVEQLQQEIKAFKRKQEVEEKEKQLSVSSQEKKIKTLTEKLKAEVKEKEDANSEIIKAKGEMLALSQKVSELDKLLKASEDRLKAALERENEGDVYAKFKKTEESLNDKIKELEHKITETEKQRQVLANQLTSARKHLIQYKEIAAANETALQDQRKAFDDLKNEMEKKVDEAEKQIKDLASSLASTETAKQALDNKLAAVEKELAKVREESATKLKALEFELETTKEALKSAQQQEETARNDFAKQLKVAEETQEKYERELVLHATNVGSLVKAKGQLKEYNTVKETLEASVKELEGKLKAAEEVHFGAKKHQEEEIAKLNTRIKDLVDQNSILHGQVEKLSSELAEVKAKPVTIDIPITSGSEVDDENTTEKLYEVIRYIRREKEIAETKNEVAQSESIRYRQRADFLEKELEETRTALEREQRRTQGHMMTPEEHKEVTDKVEKLKQVSETNKELEKQKLNLEKGYLALRGRFRSLENDVASLKDEKKAVEEERDTLAAEKTALKNEVQRWTTKNQQLMEQNTKLENSKELENLQRIKNHQEKVITALKQDNQRSKEQIEHLNKELNRVRGELQEQQAKTKQFQGLAESAKTDRDGNAEQLNQEVEKLKKVVEDKTAEIAEKNKLNTQLRRLAKKYKTQSDELLKGKIDEGTLSAAASANAESLELLENAQETQRELATKLEESQKKLREAEQKTTEQEVKIKEVEQKVQEAEKRIADAERKAKESEEKLGQTENEAKQSSQKVNELENTMSALRGQIEELKSEDEKKTNAFKERDDKNKKMLLAMKSKVTSLATTKDKVTSEIEGLKRMMKETQDRNSDLEQELEERNTRISSLLSQNDIQIARWERELEEAREANLKLQDDNEKLQLENRNIQKAFSDAKEAVRAAQAMEAQKQVRAYASSTQTAMIRAQTCTKPVHQDTSTSEGSPLTATVRPTSSSSTSQAQKTSPMPTASIRPIPVAPTPTAMVSPTVPLTQSDVMLVSSACVTMTATVTATQRHSDVISPANVLPTSHRRPPDGESGISGVRQGGAGFKAPVTRATAQVQARDAQGMDIQSEGADISGSSSTQAPEGEEYESGWPPGDNPFFDISQPQPTSSEAEPSQSSRERAEPAQFSSQHPLGKRVRIMEEFQEREEPGTSGDVSEPPEAKRVRVQEIVDPQVSSVSSSASSEGAGPSIRVVSAFEQESEPAEDELWDNKEESSQEYQDNVEQMIGMVEGASQDDDDASREAALVEERDGEEPQLGTSTATSTEPESSNEYAAGVSRQDEVPVDQADVSQREREASAVSEGLRRQPVRRQPSPFGVDPAGRGRFLRSRYQLPSFSLQPGQGSGSGPFDDADDCTVPSTPTLYIPKRNDGFAEAVSSPQVRYPVFSFGSATDPSQVSSQQSALEVGDDGLRLDETRVDLMGGEEAASVPNTPLGIVPSGPAMNSGRSATANSGRAVPSSQSGLDEMAQEQNVPQQIDLTGDDEDDEDVGEMEGGDEEEEEDEEDGNDDEIILVEESREFSDESNGSEASEHLEEEAAEPETMDDDETSGQGKEQESESFRGTDETDDHSSSRPETAEGVDAVRTTTSSDLEGLGAESVSAQQQQTGQRIRTSQGQSSPTTFQRGRAAASRPRLRRNQLSSRGSRFKSAPQKYTAGTDPSQEDDS